MKNKMTKKERKIYMRRYYKEHKEELKKSRKEYIKNYLETHREEDKARSKSYYLKHKKEIKKRHKIYRDLHKKEQALYQKLHRKELNEYQKIKRKKDIDYRIAYYLRNRLWIALKRNSKSNHILILLGCSIEFLRQHLESQFKPGMSFSNYGKWHIDHIRPCASFDLSKAREQHKCFNYKNLQPLWAKENLEKHDKILKGVK